MMQRKRIARIAWIGLMGFLIGCAKPSVSSQFEALFSSLSTGVPEYQTIVNFCQKADVAKGNFFAADFTQEPSEFRHLITKLGISEEDVRSVSGATGIKAHSYTNAEELWLVTVKVDGVDPAEKFYRVHIEGQQPYN